VSSNSLEGLPLLFHKEPDALRDYLWSIRRQAWLVVFVMVVALIAAFASISLQRSVYRASMSILVGQAGGNVGPVLGNQTITQTMKELLKNDVTSSQVISSLHLKITPQGLTKHLHVSAKPTSSVLDVDLDWPVRSQAVRILNGYWAAFVGRVRKLGALPGKGALGQFTARPVIFASIVSPPRAEPSRVSPKPVRTLGLAAVLGLLVGLILAVLRERLDDKIRSARDAEAEFGAPVIGALPGRWAKSGARTSGRSTARAEALQMFRLNLELVQNGKRDSTILLASALQEGGASVVAANLGWTLAASGKDVVCVEADPYDRGLRAHLKIDPKTPGLVQLAKKHADLDKALQLVQLNGSEVDGASVPARSSDHRGRLMALTMGGPLSMLGSIPEEQLMGAVKTLRARADYVIFDASLLAMGDGFQLMRKSDLVLIVAQCGRTTRSKARATRALLERLGAERVAVVLTGADPRLV
jgi:capsular polysaccharide biosynthesis protein/Mrp family chromosome partitioning ATPase